jgi:transposase
MKKSPSLLPKDLLEGIVKGLFPEDTCLQVIHLEMTSEDVTLVVTSTQPQGCCPLCGEPTSRVHSRYERMLQDLPFSGRRVRLSLRVRRFFCANTACPRQIFAERLPALTEAFARRTNRLRDALLEIGWALGGEAGARLCRKQAMPVCAATLLAQLRRTGVNELPTPRVLGVDDWGFQQKYPTGTILVDLEQHRPVDVLLGSDEEVLTQWLNGHAGVEVITRDRGASYRKAATKSAPHVQQVLDRWHVLKNLGEVIQKTLAQQIDVLRQAGQQVKKNTQQMSFAPTESAHPDGKLRKPPRRKPPPPSPRRAWQTAMHQQVHELATAGKTQAEIVRSLQLHPNTVHKYLRMPTFVAHYCHPHPSPVEPYRAYLEERWQQGEVMIKTLWQELQGQGFTGSYKSVWTFVRNWPLPEGMTPTSSSSSVAASTRRGAPATRTPWQVKWLLLHKPEELNAQDAAYRQALLCLSPPLSSLSALGQDFVSLIRERKSEALPPWLERAKGCPYEELRRFAQGLEREFPAVQAALTEPWSTGQVEGQITRLKLLKRQMYGRANLDLLRLRVLHVA